MYRFFFFINEDSWGSDHRILIKRLTALRCLKAPVCDHREIKLTQNCEKRFSDPYVNQARNHVSNFAEAKYIFRGERFLFLLYVLVKKFLATTKYGVSQKKLEGNARECLPVVVGLMSISFICLVASVTDLRIGHGLGPCAFGGPAQLFPTTIQY